MSKLFSQHLISEKKVGTDRIKGTKRFLQRINILRIMRFFIAVGLLFVIMLGFSLDANSNDNKFNITLTKQSLINPLSQACTYSWSPQTSGTTNLLSSISAVSDLIAWAGGEGATIIKTTDGGSSTWTNGNPNPGVIAGDVVNIYALDANTAFCTTTPTATFIYKTTNGGTNWVQVFTQAGGFIDAIQMISDTEGYALGDPIVGSGVWTLLRTTNAGVNWTSMLSAPTAGNTEFGYNNSFFIMGSNIWFGTNVAKVYRSTNLGLNWSSATTPEVVNTFAVHYNTTLLGLAGGSAAVTSAIVKSTNGGISYTTTGTPGTSLSINGIEGHGTDWWAIRSSAIIYRSTDQGVTWTSAHTHVSGAFQDIDFAIINNCPTGWAVGTTGAIAKMITMTGINNYNSEVPTSYDLSQNFPNPFNPSTNIKFSIPKSGIITLKVYDMIGKEVTTLVNEFKNAGNYIVGFNASNLPSGTYLYRISTGNFVNTKKMLLNK